MLLRSLDFALKKGGPFGAHDWLQPCCSVSQRIGRVSDKPVKLLSSRF
jgi:hypothetical protein